MESFRKSPEQRQTFFHEKVGVGEHTLELVGVEHVYEEFEKHREQIEQYIVNADWVVCETSLEVGLGLRPAQETKMFFWEIEKLAKKHGKTVVSLDPLLGTRPFEVPEENILGRVEEEANKRKIAYGAVGVVGAATVAANIASSKAPMTRRDFLRRAGVATVGAAMTGVGGVNSNDMAWYLGAPRDLIDNTQDYRDTVVAGGLTKIAELQTDEPLNIAVIYGHSHLQGLKQYLADPESAKAKRQGKYAAYEEVAKPEIAAFRYDATHDKWQKEFALANTAGKPSVSDN